MAGGESGGALVQAITESSGVQCEAPIEVSAFVEVMSYQWMPYPYSYPYSGVLLLNTFAL